MLTKKEIIKKASAKLSKNVDWDMALNKWEAMGDKLDSSMKMYEDIIKKEFGSKDKAKKSPEGNAILKTIDSIRNQMKVLDEEATQYLKKI